MPLTKFPRGVSSFGTPIFGAATTIPVSFGNYFYVRSTTGSNSAGSNGSDPSVPFATIDYAIGQCAANNDDVIVVLPGHAETISVASGIAVDIAGITIVGLGNGNRRPIITMDTATTTTIAVSAANCVVKNLIITANFADIATAIIVSAANCRLEKLEFRETAVDMNFFNVVRTNATNNAADGLEVIGCRRVSIDAAALAFVSILANENRVIINDNIDTQASAADVGHFLIMGAFVCLDMWVVGNIVNLTGDNNAQTVGVFATGSSITSTGIVAYNLVSQLDATTELFDTATLDFGHFQNFMTGTIAQSGYVLPAIDA